MFFVSDSPKTHRFIGEREKAYLVEETKKQVSAKEQGPLVFQNLIKAGNKWNFVLGLLMLMHIFLFLVVVNFIRENIVFLV